jgi:Cd2+/Zn2+-exporting ATPase
MKVKNMVKSKQTTYSKITSYIGKDLKKGLLTGVVALVLAIISSLFNNAVLACIFSILSLVIAGAEVMFKLIKGTKDAKLDTVLVITAILIPFCVGEFSVAALAMSIYKLSSVVTGFVLSILGKEFRATADVTPKNANLIDSQSNIRVVPSNELRSGDKFMVKTNDIVPVDSIVTEGFSQFDTSRVHSSASDVSLSAGDKVLAGYINTGSSVTCAAVCNYDESIVMDFNRMADMSETTSTIGEKRFMQIAKWYPLGVLALAILVLLIVGLSTGIWNSAMLKVSVLLIAATSSSFVIAVPLFTSAAVWILKKKGLAVSSAELLDEIADVNCVAFEKDGVLTDGVYKITDVYTAEGITDSDLLMIAGICVGGRAHPVSRIFTKYMNEHLKAENVMEFAGKGVECTIMNKSFICGTEDFVNECGVDVSEISGYRLYITLDNVVMGAVNYADNLSSGIATDIDELRKTGVEKVVMFTKDLGDAAKETFEISGADEYVENIDSFMRVEKISSLKQEEDATCAYIGDILGGEQAINEADVGVALINKEENGLEYSKIALIGKIKSLAEAIEISRIANGKVEIHFYCACAAKIIITLLGLFGAMNVASALIVDTILTIAALLSAKDILNK